MAGLSSDRSQDSTGFACCFCIAFSAISGEISYVTFNVR